MEKLIENALERKPGEFSPLMRKVLIVDGDEEFRTALSDALSFSQYLPFHASQGKAALRELESGSMDAVITNYQLSDMDGITLIDSVKRQCPSALAVLTGPSMPSDMRAEYGKAASVDAFLVKPFRASEFLDLLHQHGVGQGAEQS
jgi:CheY-like chemotaxis protein